MTRQQQKQATAQRLFEAAVRLFLTQGYGSTTVEQIAEAAGVAKGTFFLHFRTKKSVLSHLGAMQTARLTAALAAEPGLSERSARERLRFVYQTLGAGLEGYRDLVLLVVVESMREQGGFDSDVHSIGDFDRLLLPLVVDGQSRGELRSDLAPEHIAGHMRTTYFLSVFEWLQRGGPYAAVADELLAVLFDGLAPRAAQASDEGAGR